MAKCDDSPDSPSSCFSNLVVLLWPPQSIGLKQQSCLVQRCGATGLRLSTFRRVSVASTCVVCGQRGALLHGVGPLRSTASAYVFSDLVDFGPSEFRLFCRRYQSVMATGIGPPYNPWCRLPLSELSPHAIFDRKATLVLEVLLRIDGGRLSCRLRRRFSRGRQPELECASEFGARPVADPKPCTGTCAQGRPRSLAYPIPVA